MSIFAEFLLIVDLCFKTILNLLFKMQDPFLFSMARSSIMSFVENQPVKVFIKIKLRN